MSARARKSAPTSAEETVSELLADGPVRWWGVRHHSPVNAWLLRQVIAELRPKVILVEGPDDATGLIDVIAHPDTEAPITILSTFSDKSNVFGMNGVLSAGADIPARFRGWWPLTAASPEYQAVSGGRAAGAEVRFIDAPLCATVPHDLAARAVGQKVVDDIPFGRGAYLTQVARNTGFPDFEAWWESRMEAGSVGLSPAEYQRRVLTFAWCVRNADPEGHLADQRDGTELREQHMRHHLDQALKAHPEGPILVVVGAWHAVALPWVKAKKAGIRPDKQSETLVCAHSYRALSNLYGQHRLPGWSERILAELDGPPGAFGRAGLQAMGEVFRELREAGWAASTAELVQGWQIALGLASMRRNKGPSLHDWLDAVQMVLVKGDARVEAIEVEQAARKVLVGKRQGKVCAEAGQVPLLADWYAQCKAHRLDTTGVPKTVRLDLHRQERHRRKSAFLHQCEHLAIPMFERLPDTGRREGGHFRGADPIKGEDLHLLGETWGVRWVEEIDDRLVELSDRGPTVERAAASEVLSAVAQAQGDTALLSKLSLQAARMGLLDVFPAVLAATTDAIHREARFVALTEALSHQVLLHSFRSTLPTSEHAAIGEAISRLVARAISLLPGTSHHGEDGEDEIVDGMMTLVRAVTGLSWLGVQERSLVEAFGEVSGPVEGNPTLRGAAFGLRFTLGEGDGDELARALSAYATAGGRFARGVGRFLDGVFRTTRSGFLAGPRWVEVLDEVMLGLDWEVFKEVLPDLRRAFTRFLPAELDRLGARVARGDQEDLPDEAPLAGTLAILSAADARVDALLREVGL